MMYRDNEDFALEVRKLASIAFVPVDDVISAYEALLETAFFGQEILVPLLNYFGRVIFFLN